MVDFDDQDRKLLLKLRQLLDEMEKDSSMSALEVMWQIRTHTANQAEIPQAIFRVGDQLASVIYLVDTEVWELQFGSEQYQFQTFAEALGWVGLIQTEEAGKAGIGQDGN